MMNILQDLNKTIRLPHAILDLLIVRYSRNHNFDSVYVGKYQEQLLLCGYPVRVTKRFDKDFETIVMRFREDQGLPDRHYIDRRFIRRLKRVVEQRKRNGSHPVVGRYQKTVRFLFKKETKMVADFRPDGTFVVEGENHPDHKQGNWGYDESGKVLTLWFWNSTVQCDVLADEFKERGKSVRCERV